METKQKNTFGNYHFNEWVPEHTRDMIRNFWGQMGRTYKDWLDNVKISEREMCHHGVGPNGFGNPPNGATVIYCFRELGSDEYKQIKGKYLHRWNNMGSLIDEDGKDHTVSSCDMWVRVWQTEEEKERVLNKLKS